jgi:alpha,alpha-trehalose-phosphate synthase [UDP-forming]
MLARPNPGVSLRATLKMVLPLMFSVALGCLVFAAYQVHTEKRILHQDLLLHAETLGTSLQDAIEPLLDGPPDGAIQKLVERVGVREHLKGVAVYSRSGAALAATQDLPLQFRSSPAIAIRADGDGLGHGEFVRIDRLTLHIYAVPIFRDGQADGAVVILHDASYIDAQISRFLRDSLFNAILQTLLITALALVVVRWSFTGPLAKTTKWLRQLRSGQPHAGPVLDQGEILDQINEEVTHLARDLTAARATAKEEAFLRDSNASLWTAERLRVSVRNKLQDKPLFVVSNREPYTHAFNEKDKSVIDVVIPASGLVTALEPVLLACDGTWIAHGSGNADHEVVDTHDRLRVPPDHPSYTLRRVWMSPEEEEGYYAGFSNEGLWPLCHIAHTRPIFRPEDWLYYQKINRRFADAVLKEMEGAESPIILVQDYHFALLPRMIKEARPDARVAIFWHIPWPNPEVFGICPWQRELVDGLLGADLIGFHIQAHCNNFLGTVEHAVEALTEWDRFTVNRQGHLTLVRPYPISVAFPESASQAEHLRDSATERAALSAELGIEAPLLGVGVDRVDYTKGIPERFRAIEHFLDLNPSYQHRFTFVEIGAPSRTDIDSYKNFLNEVNSEVERINKRFQAGRWKPIVFLNKHHSHKEIARFYRAASVCLVTSLHDGMNLVAKEFVASREDDHGVLVLSTFAGAALELQDALLINPYDVQQLAGAIHRGLEMPEAEQSARMHRMRQVVREYNIYRWAANLLSDLTEIRVDALEHVETR